MTQAQAPTKPDNTFVFGETEIVLRPTDSAIVLRADGGIDLYLPQRDDERVPPMPELASALAIRASNPSWAAEQVSFLREQMEKNRASRESDVA